MNWKKLLSAVLAGVCAFSFAAFMPQTELKAAESSTMKIYEAEDGSIVAEDESAAISRGGYPTAAKGSNEISKEYKGYHETLAAMLLTAFNNVSEEIDISSLGLRATEANVTLVLDTYIAVMNAHPELFYLKSGCNLWQNSAGVISVLKPMYFYTPSEIPNMRAEFNYKTNLILSQVNSSWSQLEKVLFVHDYLVTNIAYDESLSKFDAYTAIVEGDTVCHGYSLAATHLLNKLGINSKVVTSNHLEHAWNIVYLNGAWYYMDLTWDDPTPNIEGYAYHGNFLVSERQFRVEGHDGSDWTADGSVICGRFNTTTYDNAFWRATNCALPYNGRTWYYYDANRYLRSYNFATGASAQLTRMTENWPVWGSTQFYKSNFSQMHIIGSRLYFTTPTTFKSIPLNGGQVVTNYTLTAAEKAKGYIYATYKVGSSINYGLKTSPGGYGYTGNGKFTPASTTAPAKPVVRAIPGNGQVTLSWNKVSGATSYVIYMYSAGSYKQIAETTALSYTRAGLTNGSKYLFAVRAKNAAGLSPWTTADAISVVPSAPPVKPVIKATPGNARVTLSWNRVSGATSYVIYMYNASTGRYTQIAETTALSYTRTGLSNGYKYYFAVRAKNGAGLSPWTTADAVSAVPVSAPAKPAITVKNGNGQVTLTWNKVPNATSYVIYMYNANTGLYTQIAETSLITYTRAGLANGATYKFAVRARNASGLSPWTTADAVTGRPIAPPAKPVVKATAGNGRVTLSWNKISNAASYVIYQYNPSTGSYAQIATTTATSYVRAGLSNGTTYKFAVRAKNSAGLSPWTTADAVSARPIAPPAKPAVKATAGNKNVTLSWNKVANASSYIIYQYNSSAGVYQQIVETTATTYVKSGLTNGVTYKFIVRAKNAAGLSSYTTADAVAAKPNVVPIAPIVRATAGNGRVTLTWNPIANATKYYIYQYNPSTGTYQLITTTTSTTYIRTGLTNGTTYKFIVRAYNEMGQSAYTAADAVSATPRA